MILVGSMKSLWEYVGLAAVAQAGFSRNQTNCRPEDRGYAVPPIHRFARRLQKA